MKYNEEQIIKKLTKYIESTYQQHYANKEENLQAMDIFRSLKIDQNFCHSRSLVKKLRLTC